MTRLSIGIQHHPDRGGLLGPLLEGLGGAEVVTDPQPEEFRNPWRTYRHALETTPTDATHRLIVQDDATPCRSFRPAVEQAVQARPDRMLVLCVCGEPSQSAQRLLEASWKGWSWAQLDPSLWIPAIAVVWPVRLIEPVLSYVDQQQWPAQFTADDEIIGTVMRALNETVLATVPSLIDHTDMVESVRGGHRAAYGENKGRVASCFLPDDCNPLLIDWAPGPT